MKLLKRVYKCLKTELAIYLEHVQFEFCLIAKSLSCTAAPMWTDDTCIKINQ